MNGYDATEQAYRKGYEQGRKDAEKAGWISVKDHMPPIDPMYAERGFSVDCIATDGEYWYTGYFVNTTFAGRKIGYEEFCQEEVTHWMPLPELPEVEE